MAKKHPTASKVRRESDVPDDAFVGTIRRIIDWAQENRRETIIVAAAIALVALMLALRQINIWRQDRPTPGPPVMIGPRPDGAVLPRDAPEPATWQENEP